MQALDIPFVYEAEPCRGAKDSNGNWYPLMATLDEQNRYRDREIGRLWHQYRKGECKKATGDSTPSSSVCMVEEIQVSKTYHAFTDEIINIDVFTNDPDRWPDVNIFGYNGRDRCLAFRGQACHYGAFYALAQLLVVQGKVDTFYKSPSEIKFPPQGLRPDLTYQEFAGQVEIVEYAAWLKDFPDGALQSSKSYPQIFQLCSEANDPYLAEAVGLFAFLHDNSPLVKPAQMELDQQQNQNSVDGVSASDLNSPPSLQIDEGSECHDHEQTPRLDSPTLASSADGHHVKENSSVLTTATLSTSLCGTIDHTEDQPATSIPHQTEVLQIEGRSDGERLDTILKSVSPMHLDTSNEGHHEEGPQSPAHSDVPGSPWSLFGECEDDSADHIGGGTPPQELEFTQTSRRTSSLGDLGPGLASLLLENAQEAPLVSVPEAPSSAEQEVIVQEEEQASAEDQTVPVEQDGAVTHQKTQQEDDAEMAAKLAAELATESSRVNRYSLRRRATLTTQGDNLDWTKSSKSTPAKTPAKTTNSKSAAKVKKAPAKKGVAKTVRRR